MPSCIYADDFYREIMLSYIHFVSLYSTKVFGKKKLYFATLRLEEVILCNNLRQFKYTFRTQLNSSSAARSVNLDAYEERGACELSR